MLLYISSDVILLSVFGISKAAIGTYGIAYRTVVGLQFVIPGAISMALYPRVAAAREEDARRLVPAGAGISVFLCTGLLALLFLDLPGIFSIFGDTYSSTINSVRPLLLALLPISVSYLYVSGLQARHREMSVLRLVAVVAVVNLAGNFALIPLLGVRGALIATSAAEWVAAMGALRMATPLFANPSRDAIPTAALLVPVVLSFFSVSGVAVSVALALWLVLAWDRDTFGLRSATTALRNERRVMTVTTAPN